MKNETIKTTVPNGNKRRHRKIKPYILKRCTFAAVALTLIALSTAAIALAVSGTKDVREPVDSMEWQTVSQLADPEPVVFFTLTPEQRTLIEEVVSAESRGEPYDGQVAVAQCILNACMKDGITPEQVLKEYRYTTARAEATDSVKEAVAAVFDRGEGITEEPIIYFYNPALVDSEFHESQTFVIEIANHRFFKEAA